MCWSQVYDLCTIKMDSPKVELTQPELNIKISESKLKMTQPLGPVWNKEMQNRGKRKKLQELNGCVVAKQRNRKR